MQIFKFWNFKLKKKKTPQCFNIIALKLINIRIWGLESQLLHCFVPESCHCLFCHPVLGKCCPFQSTARSGRRKGKGRESLLIAAWWHFHCKPWQGSSSLLPRLRCLSSLSGQCFYILLCCPESKWEGVKAVRMKPRQECLCLWNVCHSTEALWLFTLQGHDLPRHFLWQRPRRKLFPTTQGPEVQGSWVSLCMHSLALSSEWG